VADLVTLAAASWLFLCPASDGGAPPSDGVLLASYSGVSGASLALGISETEPEPSADCRSVPLPIPATAVRWAGVLPAELAPQLKRGLVLQRPSNPFSTGRLEVSEIEPWPAASAPVPPILPGDSLLPAARTIVFGAEERMALSRADNGAVVLECRPGEAPAGLVLSLSGRLPAGARTTLAVDYTAAPGFTLGAADESLRRREDVALLGDLPPQEATARRELAIPLDHLDARSALSLTVVCPGEGGFLRLERIALSATLATASQSRAAWAWQPERWLQDGTVLIGEARARGIDTLYVTVPIVDGQVADAPTLGRFITEAGRAGIAVWAVEGDPHAVLSREREGFVARTGALAAYNSATDTDSARLAGVQYDIEPYLVPGYGLDRAAWDAAYLDTLARLKAAARMPVTAAVPFWFAGEGRQAFLDQLARVVDGVAVMAYRSDAAAVAALAEPFLAWGAGQGLPVHVALESGPLPDEERTRFQPAAKGTLWHLDLGGRPILLWLDHERTNPHGPAFTAVDDQLLPGRRLSFAGDEVRLEETSRRLETVLRAWSSFAGLALHGVL